MAVHSAYSHNWPTMVDHPQIFTELRKALNWCVSGFIIRMDDSPLDLTVCKKSTTPVKGPPLEPTPAFFLETAERFRELYSPLNQLNRFEGSDRTYQCLQPKTYTCQYCGTRFTTRGGLRIHSRVHTGERPFACDLCDARFTQKTNLTMHMRTHTGEKPYACPFPDCNASFSQNGTLTHHVRHHTGEKPFPCPVCSMRFAWKSVMKRHLRLHTGEKPYLCEECNHRFNTIYDLKKHRKMHYNKLLKCSRCTKEFKLLDDLTLHSKIMHDADDVKYDQLASALYKLNNPESDSEKRDLSHDRQSIPKTSENVSPT